MSDCLLLVISYFGVTAISCWPGLATLAVKIGDLLISRSHVLLLHDGHVLGYDGGAILPKSKACLAELRHQTRRSRKKVRVFDSYLDAISHGEVQMKGK